MNVDIDKLSEHELIALNRIIVERLHFLQQARAHSKMLEFHVGDVQSTYTPGDDDVVRLPKR